MFCFLVVSGNQAIGTSLWAGFSITDKTRQNMARIRLHYHWLFADKNGT